MDRDEIRENLEALAERAERVSTAPRVNNAPAIEVHLLNAFFTGLKVANGLPDDDLVQWEARIAAITELEREASSEQHRKAETADTEARLQSGAAERARAHLRMMIRRIERDRERRDPDRPARAIRLAQARGATQILFHAGLIDFEELTAWNERFTEADRDELTGDVSETVEIAAPRRARVVGPNSLVSDIVSELPEPRFRHTPPVSGERLIDVLILGSQAGRWTLQSIELFEDGLFVNLWAARDDADLLTMPAPRPRVHVTDNHGTVYSASGSNGGGGGTGTKSHWRGSFGPAPAADITDLVVTVDSHRFTVSMR